MHVLILEPNHKGHRLSTVRVLLDSLLEVSDENPGQIKSITLATTQECLLSEEFETQLKSIFDRFQTTILPYFDTDRRPFYIGLSQVKNLRKLLHAGKYNHVYVPFADACLQMLFLYRLLPFVRPWPTGTTVEAQVMHNSFAYSFTKRSRRILSLLAVKHSGCDRVHLNDPIAIEYLQRISPRTLRHTRLIPDPITGTTSHNKEYARKQLGLPLDCSIIGCVGMINRRKGVDTLIRSFAQAELPENVCLVLAGRVEPAVLELLERMSDSRIIVIDSYISETELSYALSAVDLIATPYPQVVGSASIVIRAALAKRMVLTNDTGWCGYIVKKFKLGNVASVHDIPAFSRALSASILQAPNYQKGPESEYFCSFNSTENVHAHWTSLIRKKLDLPEDSRKICWNA